MRHGLDTRCAWAELWVGLISVQACIGWCWRSLIYGPNVLDGKLGMRILGAIGRFPVKLSCRPPLLPDLAMEDTSFVYVHDDNSNMIPIFAHDLFFRPRICDKPIDTL